MSEIWEIWTELAKTSETPGDVLFLECLAASHTSRIFENLADDKLKATLSIINSILNDPKTRPKGVILFSDLLGQINVSRLIGFQDAVTSGLHLVIKGLESSSACSLLADFLPKCHIMSEVNQTVTSVVVPKILSHVCDDGKDLSSQKTADEIQLVKVCLANYHGPCGPFRDRLEKMLVALIDSDNLELIGCLSEVFPMLSYSGGGGNGGEKHVGDWAAMMDKFLTTTYSVLCQLYGNACYSLETENPFDGEQLAGVKKIVESKPLLRMTLLKRRLCNLLTIISGYLRSSFPAPKQVRQKGILQLVRAITSLNPISTKNSYKPEVKEVVFLTAMTASIHEVALTVLRSLIYCVGSNIFVDGVSVEQILSSEFKWIQESPRAYENLRLELYEVLPAWLTATCGTITNRNYLTLWTTAIGVDTQVEKTAVELKILSSKNKTMKKSLHPNSQSSSSLNSSTYQSFVEKKETLCLAALKSLALLIPALDAETHKKTLEHLIKTSAVLGLFHPPPPPYVDARCRRLLYETLTALCFSPHPQSPVPLPLVISLLKKGTNDPAVLVSSFCSHQISSLERLLHPMVAPMSIPDSTPAPLVVIDFSKGETTTANDASLENTYTTPKDAADESSDSTNEDIEIQQQTSERAITSNQLNNAFHVPEGHFLVDPNNLQELIKNALSEILKDKLSGAEVPPQRSERLNERNKRRLSQECEVDILRAKRSLTKSKVDHQIQAQLVKDAHANNVTNGSCTGEEIVTIDDSDDESNLGTPSLTSEVMPVNHIVSENNFENNNAENNNNNKRLKVSEGLDNRAEEENTGPSVDEMMSSFIDLEPSL